jgi:hypothetical protein
MAHCRGKYEQLWTFQRGVLKSNGLCIEPENYTKDLQAVTCDGSSKQSAWVYEEGTGPQRFKYAAAWAKTLVRTPTLPTRNVRARCDSVGCECRSGDTNIADNTMCCCNPSGRVVVGERAFGVGSANVDCKHACAGFKDEYTAHSRTTCVGGTFDASLIGDWGKTPDRNAGLSAVRGPACRELALSDSDAVAVCSEKCTSMPGCDGFAFYPSNALGVTSGDSEKSWCCFRGDTRQKVSSGDLDTTCYAAVDLSGEYRIKAHVGGGYLTIESIENSVVTSEISNEQSRFLLERQYDGRYKIRVKPTDYHVTSDAAYLVFSNGDERVMAREDYSLSESESDKFSFKRMDAGYYAIEVEVGAAQKTWIIDQTQLKAKTGGGATANNMFFHLERMSSSKVDYEMCLDLTGTGDAMNKLSLVRCGRTATQRWYLNRYENMRTQASPDVCMGVEVSTRGAFMGTCAQGGQWLWYKAGPKIRSSLDGSCLTLDVRTKTLSTYECRGQPNQEWVWTSAGELKNKAQEAAQEMSNQELDCLTGELRSTLPGLPPTTGTVTMTSCGRGDSQHWLFDPEAGNFCAQCHKNAYCEKEDNKIECICNQGFVGDGYDCMGISCMALDDPANGRVSISHGGKYPSHAVYACDDGYHIDDNSKMHRTCDTNGAWSGDAPACIQNYCFLPMMTTGLMFGDSGKVPEGYKAPAAEPVDFYCDDPGNYMPLNGTNPSPICNCQVDGGVCDFTNRLMCVKSLIPKTGPLTVGFPEAPVLIIERPFDNMEIHGTYPDFTYHFFGNVSVYATVSGSVSAEGIQIPDGIPVPEGIDVPDTVDVPVSLSVDLNIPPIPLGKCRVIAGEPFISLTKEMDMGGFGTTTVDFNASVTWVDMPGSLAAIIGENDGAQINITHDMETHNDGISGLRNVIINEIEKLYGMSALAPPILDIASGFATGVEAGEAVEEAASWIGEMIPEFTVTQRATCDLTFMNMSEAYALATRATGVNPSKWTNLLYKMKMKYNVTSVPKSFECVFHLMSPQPYCGDDGTLDGQLGTLNFDFSNLPSLTDLYYFAINPVEKCIKKVFTEYMNADMACRGAKWAQSMVVNWGQGADERGEKWKAITVGGEGGSGILAIPSPGVHPPFEVTWSPNENTLAFGAGPFDIHLGAPGAKGLDITASVKMTIASDEAWTVALELNGSAMFGDLGVSDMLLSGVTMPFNLERECYDTLDWDNGHGRDCDWYAMNRCDGSQYVGAPESEGGYITPSAERNYPDQNCCSCGKVATTDTSSDCGFDPSALTLVRVGTVHLESNVALGSAANELLNGTRMWLIARADDWFGITQLGNGLLGALSGWSEYLFPVLDQEQYVTCDYSRKRMDGNCSVLITGTICDEPFDFTVSNNPGNFSIVDVMNGLWKTFGPCVKKAFNERANVMSLILSSIMVNPDPDIVITVGNDPPIEILRIPYDKDSAPFTISYMKKTTPEKMELQSPGGCVANGTQLEVGPGTYQPTFELVVPNVALGSIATLDFEMALAIGHTQGLMYAAATLQLGSIGEASIEIRACLSYHFPDDLLANMILDPLNTPRSLNVPNLEGIEFVARLEINSLSSLITRRLKEAPEYHPDVMNRRLKEQFYERFEAAVPEDLRRRLRETPASSEDVRRALQGVPNPDAPDDMPPDGLGGTMKSKYDVLMRVVQLADSLLPPGWIEDHFPIPSRITLSGSIGPGSVDGSSLTLEIQGKFCKGRAINLTYTFKQLCPGEDKCTLPTVSVSPIFNDLWKMTKECIKDTFDSMFGMNNIIVHAVSLAKGFLGDGPLKLRAGNTVIAEFAMIGNPNYGPQFDVVAIDNAPVFTLRTAVTFPILPAGLMKTDFDVRIECNAFRVEANVTLFEWEDVPIIFGVIVDGKNFSDPSSVKVDVFTAIDAYHPLFAKLKDKATELIKGNLKGISSGNPLRRLGHKVPSRAPEVEPPPSNQNVSAVTRVLQEAASGWTNPDYIHGGAITEAQTSRINWYNLIPQVSMDFSGEFNEASASGIVFTLHIEAWMCSVPIFNETLSFDMKEFATSISTVMKNFMFVLMEKVKANSVVIGAAGTLAALDAVFDLDGPLDIGFGLATVSNIENHLLGPDYMLDISPTCDLSFQFDGHISVMGFLDADLHFQATKKLIEANATNVILGGLPFDVRLRFPTAIMDPNSAAAFASEVGIKITAANLGWIKTKIQDTIMGFGILQMFSPLLNPLFGSPEVWMDKILPKPIMVQFAGSLKSSGNSFTLHAKIELGGETVLVSVPYKMVEKMGQQAAGGIQGMRDGTYSPLADVKAIIVPMIPPVKEFLLKKGIPTALRAGKAELQNYLRTEKPTLDLGPIQIGEIWFDAEIGEIGYNAQNSITLTCELRFEPFEPVPIRFHIDNKGMVLTGTNIPIITQDITADVSIFAPLNIFDSTAPSRIIDVEMQVDFEAINKKLQKMLKALGIEDFLGVLDAILEDGWEYKVLPKVTLLDIKAELDVAKPKNSKLKVEFNVNIFDDDIYLNFELGDNAESSASRRLRRRLQENPELANSESSEVCRNYAKGYGTLPVHGHRLAECHAGRAPLIEGYRAPRRLGEPALFVDQLLRQLKEQLHPPIKERMNKKWIFCNAGKLISASSGKSLALGPVSFTLHTYDNSPSTQSICWRISGTATLFNLLSLDVDITMTEQEPSFLIQGGLTFGIFRFEVETQIPLEAMGTKAQGQIFTFLSSCAFLNGHYRH